MLGADSIENNEDGGFLQRGAVVLNMAEHMQTSTHIFH